MDQGAQTSAWFGKAAAVAALLLLACGIASARLGTTLQLPATTTRDGTLVTLNRYVDNPVPDIVLVGSSMGFRLKEEYFATPGLRNLALAGGSPLTGLQIIVDQRQLPKLVVIETNVLARPLDKALIARFSGKDGKAGNQPLFLRPVRTAVAAYENWMHAPPTNADIKAALGRLLSRPPRNFDNHVYVERAIREGESEDPSAALKANVATAATLIDALEKRGVRVLLMEMPYAPGVDATLYARTTREIVRRAFPDQARWLPINVDRDELRWDDGVHLDERSAVVVCRYLDGRFKQAGI